MIDLYSTEYIPIELIADICSVSVRTVNIWLKKRNIPYIDSDSGRTAQISNFWWNKNIHDILNSPASNSVVTPIRQYTSMEFFAGAGGLALGFEMAGINSCVINEIDKYACQTMAKNRPQWNIINDDIKNVDVKNITVDIVSGGFPCQPFSYAGNRMGFGDTRGTLFFEFAKIINTIRPPVFVAENVRGLLLHDGGRTLNTIKQEIKNIGYTLVDCSIYKTMFYNVPQKRERLIIVAVRNDLMSRANYSPPLPSSKIYTLRDAFYSGELYATDVEPGESAQYSTLKRDIISKIPQGGNWTSLSIEDRERMMGKLITASGGNTSVMRRLSLDTPSLTLTCSPTQRKIDRCHPLEHRPLSVREYARVQTFPDEWEFCGSIANKYKQIGNAVPPNFAREIGKSIINLLNSLQ